jgi:hypothetical protein
LAIRTTLLAAAVLATALAGPQAAPAKRLSCGATISADTVLRSDVEGCGGTALTVGADGVTLDLGGHTVQGAIVASGREDVAIRRGVVAGDVKLDRVRSATVRGLRMRHGSIACIRSAGCTIARNVVSGGGIVIAESESGVPNRVRRNVVSGAPGAAITANRTDSTSITRNIVRSGAVGIETSHAADLLIGRNQIVNNAGNGVSGSFGSRTTIVRNVIAANGGDGISLRTWGGETLIAHNAALQNGGDGIRGLVVAHWRVRANLAAGNRGSGIAIAGAVEDATLARNHVRANGGLGIDAAADVADGGGNRAHANGVPVQCAGVSCS